MHGRQPTGKARVMTKLRFGLIVGFASGYYLGAKAGRGRYVQLRNAAAKKEVA